MENIEEKLQKMILQDSNNKIETLNQINRYLTQYSTITSHIIPLKYKDTITKELEELQEPVTYSVQELENEQLNITILNYGVLQRENILKNMKARGI